MKVPAEIEELGNAVLAGKSHSAVLIDLDSNSNVLSVKKTVSKKAKHPYRQCLKHFSDDRASYAIVNINLETGEGQKRNKVVMLMWAPDTAKAKVKMTAASGWRALRSKFSKCNAFIEMQAKEANKNINDILAKALRAGEGCTSIEGVPVSMNDCREYVFADGCSHSDTDEDEED